LDVWKRWTPDARRGNYQLLVAVKEDDSDLLFLSPKDNAPHTLIAGATGSGKSVLMQNIVLAIACTNTAEQAQIALIDPKLGVDYFAFEGLPHLGDGIIDEQARAINRLEQLVEEMDRRYTVLRQNRCANVFELNQKADATEPLPYLWVIHDEFAEWFMTEGYRDSVATIVSRGKSRGSPQPYLRTGPACLIGRDRAAGGGDQSAFWLAFLARSTARATMPIALSISSAVVRWERLKRVASRALA
jgi:S-DNA-T family DNA segregation ATPase FtsK/SpoIIIE